MHHRCSPVRLQSARESLPPSLLQNRAAGFLAHGSSVIRPLSRAPCWACDLHVSASPSRGIPTSLRGVLRASAALLSPITCIPPSPRQHIRELSSRPWLLEESHHRAVCG